MKWSDKWPGCKSSRIWILLSFVLLAGGAGITAPLPSSPASLAPPVISRTDHPFDPDWPHVQIILANKCTGCHRPDSDRYDLSSYESLRAAGQQDDLPAIVPGDPEESLLWQYVSWNVDFEPDSELPEHPSMPPDHLQWLTRGQLETVRRWIENGARQYAIGASTRHRPLLESDFPSARQCAACHPRQYEQWSRSMHAYAQHSPVFEAFTLTMIERTGGTVGTFCSRCHTPVGTALGENGSMRNVHRSRISMEGVTCIVCHRTPDGRYKASGRLHVQPGQLLDTCVYGPFGDPVDPGGVHPASGRPFIKTSQFCGTCHDVTLPTGVRLEEAFSEWQNSPAAKEGVTCQHCHMGPVQGVPTPDHHRPLGRAAVVPGVDPEQLPLRHLSDHTFAGPDYSLLPDTEFPEKLDWMYEQDYRQTDRLTPYQKQTLNELRRRNRKSLRQADQKRYELLSHAAELQVVHPPRARCNQHIDLNVQVISKFSGHSLPTGFTSERQVWVSVEVRAPNGQLVFASGDLDHNHDLRDEHSHEVLTGALPMDRYLLNFQSKFTSLTQKGTDRSVVLPVNRHLAPLNFVRPSSDVPASIGRPQGFRIAKASLPPLKRRNQAYPVHLTCGAGVYHVDVKLNYRHLPPNLLDHIGVSYLKHLLEIVVIDHYQGVIEVTP